MAEKHRLVRSFRDRKLAGVCSGLARRYGWNAKRVRLVFVITALLGVGLIVYFFLWLFLPSDEHVPYDARDTGGVDPALQSGLEIEELRFRYPRPPFSWWGTLSSRRRNSSR